MRHYFVAFVFVAFVTGIVLIACQQPDPPGIAQSQQPTSTTPIPTATLEGTFWVDRWGQGRFAPFGNFVGEAVFPKLREHTGIPIRIKGAVDRPEYYDSPSFLTDFNEVERLPQPVSLSLRWLTTDNTTIEEPILRARNPHEISFEVQVTNKEDIELILTSEDFAYSRKVRHPRNSVAYGTRPGVRQRGVLRYDELGMQLPPQYTKSQPRSDDSVRIKEGATHSFNVTVSEWRYAAWEPNEYELMVEYRKHDNPKPGGGTFVYSNPLSLDVLSDDPRQHDVIEMHLRQRDKTVLQAGQPVPLEIVFHNRSQTELRFPFYKGSKDDLDLSDMLFCYGSDGRILPLTNKVAGPMEIRIPVNESFTLPVDAPEGTVVARAVFYNPDFSPKLKSPDDPDRFTHGWHWSEHWQHPSVRAQVP
jgi:hypothetical protein